MKQSTSTFTENDFERNSNETIIRNFASGTDSFEQSSDKALFEKECREGMSIEEFRAAALEHINSLPWKK